MLLEKAADANKALKGGGTPLSAARQGGHTECAHLVELALAAPADTCGAEETQGPARSPAGTEGGPASVLRSGAQRNSEHVTARVTASSEREGPALRSCPSPPSPAGLQDSPWVDAAIGPEPDDGDHQPGQERTGDRSPVVARRNDVDNGPYGDAEGPIQRVEGDDADLLLSEDVVAGDKAPNGIRATEASRTSDCSTEKGLGSASESHSDYGLSLSEEDSDDADGMLSRRSRDREQQTGASPGDRARYAGACLRPPAPQPVGRGPWRTSASSVDSRAAQAATAAAASASRHEEGNYAVPELAPAAPAIEEKEEEGEGGVRQGPQRASSRPAERGGHGRDRGRDGAGEAARQGARKRRRQEAEEEEEEDEDEEGLRQANWPTLQYERGRSPRSGGRGSSDAAEGAAREGGCESRGAPEAQSADEGNEDEGEVDGKYREGGADGAGGAGGPGAAENAGDALAPAYKPRRLTAQQAAVRPAPTAPYEGEVPPLEPFRHALSPAEQGGARVYPLPLSSQTHVAFALPHAQRALERAVETTAEPRREDAQAYADHLRGRGGRWLWAWSRLVGRVVKTGTPAALLFRTCDAHVEAAVPSAAPVGDLAALQFPPLLVEPGRWASVFDALRDARDNERRDERGCVPEDTCARLAEVLDAAFPNAVRAALLRQLGMVVTAPRAAVPQTGPAWVAAALAVRDAQQAGTNRRRGPLRRRLEEYARCPCVRSEAAALRVVRAAQAAVEEGGDLLRASNTDAARVHPELPATADPDNDLARDQRAARDEAHRRRLRRGRPGCEADLHAFAVRVSGAVRVRCAARSARIHVVPRREQQGRVVAREATREANAEALGVVGRGTEARCLAAGLQTLHGATECTVPGTTEGCDALAIVAVPHPQGLGPAWAPVLGARLRVNLERDARDERRVGGPQELEAAVAAAGRGRDLAAGSKFVCGQSAEVAASVFGDLRWPGAQVVQNRTRPRAEPFVAEGERLMVVRVRDGAFDVPRGKVRVTAGHNPAIFDLGRLEDRGTGAWATEEAVEARARLVRDLAELVPASRREGGGGGAVFAVVRSGRDLYLVMGATGRLIRWWRPTLRCIRYGEAQGGVESMPGKPLHTLLREQGALEGARVVYEQRDALRVLEPQLPRETGGADAADGPASEEERLQPRGEDQAAHGSEERRADVQEVRGLL